MTDKERMFDFLNGLLKAGEKLLFPIYGILYEGDVSHYGYFGFTQTHFLVVRLSSGGKYVESTEKIPLHIKSVGVNKSSGLLRQYSIYINFSDSKQMKILASEKVLGLNTQKENFPAFLNHLKSISGYTENTDISRAEGSKIRQQYFNVFIYYFLAFLPAIPLMVFIIGSEYESYSDMSIFSLFAEAIPVWAVFVLPFVILSVLNRLVFGKTICVINHKEIILEGSVIPLKYLKAVSYTPRIPQKHKQNHTFATFRIVPPDKPEYTVDIAHFPAYGLRIIKSRKADTVIKLTKSGMYTVLFSAFAPTVISVAAALLIRLF